MDAGTDPATDPAGDPATGPVPARAPGPRGALLAGSGLLLVALLALVSLLPVPYAALSPGPVRDTLGEQDGEPVISITGLPTYPTSGALDLTTVSVQGGPSSPLTVAELLWAWREPSTSLLRREQLYPQGQSADEAEEEGQAEMTGSQEAAKVAALRELGIEVPTGLTVADTLADTADADADAADDGLRRGDVITSVDGTAVDDVAALRAQVAAAEVGQELAVGVRRDDEDLVVPVRTSAGEDGRPRLGVTLSTYDLPVDIEVRLADVIGPSAGTMFALAIVDQLTPGEMTGGERIAGTGSIDADGQVGVIGGLRQKVLGAQAAGADYFLAPAAECPEVRGQVPAGVRLVPVRTLHEARLAVEAIGRGESADLPSCPG
ncbi:YlbL family protein [Kineococcus glutinatus]